MVHATRLLQFSQKFRRFYDRQFAALLQETGFSMREFHVLLFFINNPGFDTARDVTEYRGLAKSQVSQAVELLCSRRLLERTADPGDRRIIHLRLTASGTALAQQARTIQTASYERLMDGFSPEEEEQFHDLLSRVLDNGDLLENSSHTHPSI